MYKIIKKSESTLREISETYIARNYITKDVSPNFSLAVNSATDHLETETTLYDRIYYVLSGEISLKIDGDVHTVKPGDGIFISKNTTYEFSGTFEAVVVNQPAFGT